jgi:hypothetical protein
MKFSITLYPERVVYASGKSIPPPPEGWAHLNDTEGNVMVKPHDEARIRKAVRNQIIELLRHDLDGGELLMKEVWEQCGDVDEQKVAGDEIRAVIDLLAIPAGDLPELVVDPRRANQYGDTGIYVRARTAEGAWGSHDIAMLDLPSLLAWVRWVRRGDRLVAMLLGHDPKAVHEAAQ